MYRCEVFTYWTNAVSWMDTAVSNASQFTQTNLLQGIATVLTEEVANAQMYICTRVNTTVRLCNMPHTYVCT